MKAPNKAQKTLLIAGLGSIAAIIIYLKYFKKPAAAPAPAGGTSSFTGGYDLYQTHYSNDGMMDFASEPPVTNPNHKAACKMLMDALAKVRALLNTKLNPTDRTHFKEQEMKILAQLQRLHCADKNKMK